MSCERNHFCNCDGSCMHQHFIGVDLAKPGSVDVGVVGTFKRLPNGKLELVNLEFSEDGTVRKKK